MHSAGLKRPIGFVPTMGAFHEGHLGLMRLAGSECASVVVSLFVNPTQFGANEDLDRYPRRESEDARMAESAGVDVLFCPSSDEMFPRRSTTVRVQGVTDRWEGPRRPGHFDGVATVVLKLFNIVGPDVSYFGLKDLQQCAVLRRMAEDLDVPVDLRFMETVREDDGLAMSSRNAYLSPSERSLAPELYRTLLAASKALANGESAISVIDIALSTLKSRGFAVDYLSLVDPVTMEEVDKPSPGTRLIVAARLGAVRLLDNVPVGGLFEGEDR